jgi:D-alanyl-lipoteichoic acid acyltransferase DltB (MBOAT superfamily)
MGNSILFLPGVLVIYILASRIAMRRLRGRGREMIMALLNLAGVCVCFFALDEKHAQHHVGLLLFTEYVCMVLVQYILLRLFSNAEGYLPWLAFFCPIAYLVVLRYVPGSVLQRLTSFAHGWLPVPYVIGLSYMAFRCSRLVLEVRNGSVPKPGIWEYLNFAFFLPIMSVGPINTYANHRRGFEPTPYEVPVGRAALRILVGLVKFHFLGAVLKRLTYDSFLLNGHPHHWIDLPIAMIFYFLYLYCDFSGFCDMAIGAAALIGIPVLENFDHPFAARNIKEFWSRWHITLSQWMRDVVFAPLSKYLVRVMGPSNANHAVAIAVFVIFLLVGIWHGTGLHYAVFGAMQAFGVVANHYYTIFLKKRLGREGFKAYNENRWIHAAAVVCTFLFYAASLMFFANTMRQIPRIFHTLH